MMKSLLMEFLGTFFLVFVFAASGNALAVAAVLTLMIYVGAQVSGAQYNPAVTFGMLVAGKITNSKAVGYMIIQFIAGILAVVAVSTLGGRSFVVSPGENVGILQAALAEFMFTFTLVLTVFMTMVDRKHTENPFYGVAVGLNILAGALSVGALSGGTFNPVIGVAPQLYRLFTGESIVVQSVAVYTIAPLFGGMLAALAYGVFSAKDKHPHEHPVHEEKHHHATQDVTLDNLVV